MKDCHSDLILDSMLKQAVTVKLKNGKEYSGILRETEFGFGYVIDVFNKPFNVKFNKSQLKELKAYEGKERM